jgi:hypothetical protein
MGNKKIIDVFMIFVQPSAIGYDWLPTKSDYGRFDAVRAAAGASWASSKPVLTLPLLTCFFFLHFYQLCFRIFCQLN